MLIHAATFASYMQGALKIAKRLPAAAALAMTLNFAGTGSDIFNPNAAAEILRGKRVMTPAEFERLDAGYRRYAFTVAQVDAQNLRTRVRDHLAKAVEEGQTLKDFREAVDAAFDAAGVTRMQPYHLQTMFETNVMQAYSAANWDMLHHPDVVGLFPKLRINTVADTRRSLYCTNVDGITLPADDPYWQTHWPPFHHRCRSTIDALDGEEASQAEDVLPDANTPPPERGFGQTQGVEGHWKIGETLAKEADIGDFEIISDQEKAHEWVQSEAYDWREELTGREIDAAAEYKRDSRPINEYLRGLSSPDEDEEELLREQILHLDYAVSKGHLYEDTTLYRGLRPEDIGWDSSDDPALLLGSITRDSAYFSTSRSLEAAQEFGRVILQVRVPAGTRAGFLEDLGHHEDRMEAEVLLARDTVVKGIDVEMDGPFTVLLCEMV